MIDLVLTTRVFLQLPQARLVTSRWLVHTALKLEGKHGRLHGRHRWHRRPDLEAER